MPILVASTAGPALASPLRRKTTARADGGRFTWEADAEAAREAPAVAFVCPLALLQLQEAPPPDAGGGRAASIRRGMGLLDRLDELRLALLSGAIPPGRLKAIADALATRPGGLDDPRLGGLIAEIELRCAVELAKFRRREAAAPSQAPQTARVSPSSSKG